ncbi:MAG: sialidase family protein [Thermoplasmatales archaeon]|nr:sialidase family protein [Thermoplasmatales archaeon]
MKEISIHIKMTVFFFMIVMIITSCSLPLGLALENRDANQAWSSNTKLSYEALNPCRPEICVDGNNIYVVWSDARYENPEYEYGQDFEIFFKKSGDGGMTWTDDIRLTNNSYQKTADYWCSDTDPRIAVNGNNIHVVWDRNIGSLYTPNSELYYIKSANGGETWDNEKQLTNSSGSATASNIAVNEEEVYVVWADDREGSDKLYYKHSEDNGANWDEEIKLSDTGAGYTDNVCSG